MAFSHGSKAHIYANGYNLTSYLRSITAPASADTHGVTTFGATAKAYIPGLKDATLSVEGVYDGATDAVDQVLQAALGGTSTIWSWCLADDVFGNPCYGFDSIETSYEIDTPVDDVAVVSAEAQSKVGMERAIIHQILTSETATGNGNTVDNGAATTNGGVGYIQVTAISGAGASLTGKVQHSTDDITYVDLVTFTAVTAAHNAQRVAVTGTVNRYTRARWEIAGTTPSATFLITFGRK